jgi:hypothetical protein
MVHALAISTRFGRCPAFSTMVEKAGAYTHESNETIRAYVCSAPNSGTRADIPGPPLRAISDHSAHLRSCYCGVADELGELAGVVSTSILHHVGHFRAKS